MILAVLLDPVLVPVGAPDSFFCFVLAKQFPDVRIGHNVLRLLHQHQCLPFLTIEWMERISGLENTDESQKGIVLALKERLVSLVAAALKGQLKVSIVEVMAK